MSAVYNRYLGNVLPDKKRCFVLEGFHLRAVLWFFNNEIIEHHRQTPLTCLV